VYESDEEFILRATVYANDLSHNRVTPPLRGEELPIKYQAKSKNNISATEIPIGLFATLLGVSVKTLQRWDESGDLKAHRSSGGRRYYSYDQFTDYFNSNPTKDNSIEQTDKNAGKVENHYKPAAFAHLVGVSVSTLQRWDNEGILIAGRNRKNRRYYTDEHLMKIKKHFEAKAKDNRIYDDMCMPNRNMTSGDVAKMYGVSVKTVQNWDRNDILSSDHREGGKRVYKADEAHMNEDGSVKEGINRKTAADMIGVSASTLRRWEKNGILKAYISPTGKPYYTEEQIKLFIEKKEKDEIRKTRNKMKKKKTTGRSIFAA